MRKLTLGMILTGLLLAQTEPPADLYYLAFLRPAADRTPLSKADGERIQTAHMANIRSLAERGILVAAGPFGDTPPTISGVFVFKTASVDEARRIAADDPTVVEHRNVIDVVAWRGPKGIGAEYFRLHKEDPTMTEGMGVQPFGMLYRGASWDQSGRAKILAAHDEYVNTLQHERKLAAAGPVESGEELLAILIFNRISDEEARRLVNDDPAVKAGVLRVEYHRWWCAAHVLPE
jgi:uncharacterized protein YciI